MEMKQQQIQDIQQLLEENKMKEGDIWYVVSMSWWKVWKKYCKTQQTETNGLVPPTTQQQPEQQLGQIKNDDICLPNVEPRVLRKGLVENVDYTLLPAAVWETLYATYQGNPIPRQVIVTGMYSKPRVEVYPIVVKIFTWTTEQKEPSPLPTPPSLSYDHSVERLYDPSVERLMLFSSTLQLREVEKNVLQMIRENHPSLFPDRSQELRLCFRRAGEILWMSFKQDLLRGKLLDLELSSNYDDVDIPCLLVECKNELGLFLTDVAANAWRHEIRVGELIDAQDSEGKWYESRVISIEFPQSGKTCGKIGVHFMGWTSKWDKEYEFLSDLVAPLHTKVNNWRDFRINDVVEVGIPEGAEAQRKWHKGKVLTIDEENEKILIAVDDSNVDQVWRKIHGEDICEYPSHVKERKYYSGSGSYGTWGRTNTRGRPCAQGVVGLQNLGNTCFMNSMLQCINNAEVLTNYFLSGQFRSEINKNNPLGMGGRTAEAYADLLHDIWSGKFSVVVPSKLKAIIGQYAPQFAGYQQQDSQEFMSFLLDGLHEDLNRVHTKPYTEAVESKGRRDEEVAAESWKQYLKRNQSVIVDNFMGQLRSHVTCPVCANESTTFDPYMSLSVPLPINETKRIQISLHRCNGEGPTRFHLSISTNGRVADVKNSICSSRGLSPEHIVAVGIMSGKVIRKYSDDTPLSDIVGHVYYFYETDDPFPENTIMNGSPMDMNPNNDDSPISSKLIRICHRVAHGDKVDGGKNFSSEKWSTLSLSMPHVISLPSTATNRDLRERIWRQTRRLCKDSSKFTLDHLPFSISIVDPDSALEDKEVSNNDMEFSIGCNAEVVLQWEPNEYCASEGDMISVNHQQLEYQNNNNSSSRYSKMDLEIDLRSCFLRFMEREQLGENDTWYCPKCKEHQRAHKKFDLWSVPKILIVQLKRFRYAQNTYFMQRDKIDSLVSFPIHNLDMSEYVRGPQKSCSQSLLYDLFAVSEHSGGLGGGHYTAKARNKEDGRWYSFNDSHCSPTDPEDSITSQAYVLFYVRKDGEL